MPNTVLNAPGLEFEWCRGISIVQESPRINLNFMPVFGPAGARRTVLVTPE
jgi:hypothetical protein